MTILLLFTPHNAVTDLYDFLSICVLKKVGKQTVLVTIDFLKMSYFFTTTEERKVWKILQVWNDMRVSK